MEKTEPSYTVSGNVNGPGTIINSVEVPLKLKIELPYDASIPLLRVYISRENDNLKKDMHSNVHINTIYNS